MKDRIFYNADNLQYAAECLEKSGHSEVAGCFRIFANKIQSRTVALSKNEQLKIQELIMTPRQE